MSGVQEAGEAEESPRWNVRRVLAVAMIVVLVLISIFVVVRIAKDGSTKDTPPHSRSTTTSSATDLGP
jgi:hypothetical protein